MVRRQVRRFVGRVHRQLVRRLVVRRRPPWWGTAVPRPEPRVDPVPLLEPLPAARYAFVIGTVPRRFGGRTASILTKARLLREIGGVGSTVVTLHHTRSLAQIVANLRRRGLLIDGVEVVNLYDRFRGLPVARGAEVRHEVDEPGLTTVAEGDGAFRLVRDGVCRVRKRYDQGGRLAMRLEFDERGSWTRSEEFGQDGILQRSSRIEHDLPREEVYVRADGSPYLRKDFRVDPRTGTATVTRVTLLDTSGQPTGVLADDAALAHHFLDELFGGERAFVTIESRRNDGDVLGYVRSNVKRLAVVHNLHLAPPGDHPADVLSTYRPLFEHSDDLAAVVFLTNAQRADAEAHYGRQDNYRVVPHPAAAEPERVPFEQRDPHLVVMLTRLHPQKQLEHAVRAFARVVEAVPTARLEIHGEGPERASLQRLVDRHGLGGSVTLPGYTRNPGAVYRGAALSLLTSRHEGYPLTLLETLSHGCPVVTYDVKYGPSEIVDDGATGFLVPHGDVAGLAQRVVQVLTDEALRRRLSEAAATPDPRFSRETFVARWSQVFRDLDAQGWD